MPNDFRRRRVERVKEQMRRGTYSVDPYAVVQSMLDRLRPQGSVGLRVNELPLRDKRAKLSEQDTFPKGRSCPKRGCQTILCRYNQGPLCYCHTPEGDGVVIEVAPDEWQRVPVAELLAAA